MGTDDQGKIHFRPPRNGTGWPYSFLMLMGAGICAYLAGDLWLAFAGYDRTPPSDYIFVAVLAAISLAFAAAAWAFWYFPWSWAHLVVDDRGVALGVRGFGAMPTIQLEWVELAEVHVMILPRHASTLTFRTREGSVKTIRAASLNDGLDDVLSALGQFAARAGFDVQGAPLKAPVLGRRTWTVAAP